MSNHGSLVAVHLLGEGRDEISLDTLPGKFTRPRTGAALTPYGGLAAWSGFLKQLGIIERLAEHCPVLRTSPNAAPVQEVLHSFQLSALVEGKRFCHVRWLNDEPAIATMMNLERVRGEDALPRLAKEMSVEQLREWMHRPQTELYATLSDHFIADWDSTVNTRYGHQEDAVVGDNPHKRGRKRHHPLICVAARTRLCLHLEWRPSDTVGCQQLAETTVKLHGWSRERRIVIVRTLRPTHPTPQDLFGETPEDDVAVYVTNLEIHEAKPEQVALLYAQRADTENVFDELKNQWGFRGHCSQRAVVTQLAARLVLLNCNLWSLFTRLMGLNPGHHTEAIKSRRSFLFMAAQVVESGRQRTVKLAVKHEWWIVLKACYERLRTWLATTAPQWEAQGDLLRQLARQTTNDPLEWPAQPSLSPSS